MKDAIYFVEIIVALIIMGELYKWIVKQQEISDLQIMLLRTETKERGLE